MSGSASSGADVAIVTGPHRSGTTFLASILDAAPETVSIGVEPLNATWGLRRADTWYPAIRPGGRLDREIRQMLDGAPVRWSTPGESVREQISAYRRGRRRNRRLAQARRDDHTLIWKDPFLSLSLDYAAQHTRRPVIVSIRHPAAWAMSIRRVGWHPGELLDSARARPELSLCAERVGLPVRRWREAPLLDAAAWMWSVLVEAITEQASRLGDAVEVVPLENFETDPVQRGVELIERVGLTTSASTIEIITELTHGDLSVPAGTTTHVLKRNTESSISAWRTRLSAAEQLQVWRIAEPIASRFYTP